MNKYLRGLYKAIFVLLLATNSHHTTIAQVAGNVIYEGTWPLTNRRIIKGKGELVFSNTQSSLKPIGLYKNHIFNEGTSQVIGENEDLNNKVFINVQHGDTSRMDNLSLRDPFNIFVDIEKGELLQKVKNTTEKTGFPIDSIILLSENTGIASWTLHGEQRLIGNCSCQKATTRFRGRDYTAWFTPEIPVSFGPWKLNGLPGLILEVTDSTHEVYFLATSIAVENGKSKTLNAEINIFPVVKQKDYQQLLWNEDREVERKAAERGQRLQAKSPQGVTITITQIISRVGIELEFEFLPK